MCSRGAVTLEVSRGPSIKAAAHRDAIAPRQARPSCASRICMAVTSTGGYVPAAHIKPVGDNESDFVVEAVNALSARPICGAARHRSASIAPGLRASRAHFACGIATGSPAR